MINFSADANENVSVAPVSETKDAMSFDFSEPEPYRANEIVQQFEQPIIPTEEPHIEPELPSAPLIPNEQIPEAEVAQLIESASAPVPEPEPPVVENESVVKEAAIAAVAVAATTAVIAAKTATSSKSKTTDPKKPEIKGKLAPIKKATTTTTAASKLAAKPSTTTASKTAAAPRVASRTVAPKVASTTEKKTTATTTSARRPLSNGSKYPRICDDFYSISGSYNSFDCFDLTLQLVLHQP